MDDIEPVEMEVLESDEEQYSYSHCGLDGRCK